MIDMKPYGLTKNPFLLLPDSRVTNWAGRADIKKQMMDVVESMLLFQKKL